MASRDFHSAIGLKVNDHFIWRDIICVLRILLVLFGLARGASTVRAACVSDGQGGISNNGGNCTVDPPVNRITATGIGTTTANGVTLSVPYGVAVAASGGASVNLGQDDVAGPPAISAPAAEASSHCFRPGSPARSRRLRSALAFLRGAETSQPGRPPVAILHS